MMNDDMPAASAAAAASIATTASLTSTVTYPQKRKRSASGAASIAEEQHHQQTQQQQTKKQYQLQQHQLQSPPAATTDEDASRTYFNHGSTPASTQQSRHGHLQINYLVRQFGNDMPIVSYEDTCPNIICLLNEYNGVFDRHESIASNLGAPSTGAEWVRRFERMFDAPPRIVSHPPSCQPNVTWLDVVAFASAYPDHFTLSPEDHVPRVCELRIKECDVVISEHDFEAIKSGGLRNMIPTQPVAEDEEKELGALQILEKSVNEVVHFADQVALRGRVFARRLGERKAAIVDRRSDHLDGDINNVATDANTDPALATSTRFTTSSPAVVSQAIHDELLRAFNHVAAQRMQPATRRPPRPQFMGDLDSGRSSNGPPPLMNQFESAPFYAAVPRRVHRRSEPDGPFRAEISARTDALQRGERIYPPCDRCRRLRIDCLKNLTACAGCTKKHAKCSWRDVKPEELGGSPPPPLGADEQTTPTAESARAHQMSAFRHDPHARHDDLNSFGTAVPQQSHGSHHTDGGYEPAFDPAFGEVDDSTGPSTVDDAGSAAVHQQHELEAARVAAHEHARVQAAARSLAMAAIENQTTSLSSPSRLKPEEG